MKVWDLRTNKIVQEFTKHSFDVVAVEFVGDLCVSASKDGTIGAWHFSLEESGHLLNIPDSRLITSLKSLENQNSKVIVAVAGFDGSLSFDEISLNSADPVINHLYTTPATT